jgi:hypothetical protein
MNSIKVIFLDLDGVLVLNGSVCMKCCEHLNILTKETNAKIVISSTWRVKGIEYVKDYLKDYINGDIIDLTPSLKANSFKAPRGTEIKEWLRTFVGKKNCVESYVILDDSKDYLISQIDNYVNINHNKGFDKISLKKAIDILSIIKPPVF